MSASWFKWQNLEAMTKHKDWREKYLAEGLGLGPFAYRREIDDRLRQEIPFGQFAKDVNDQLPDIDLKRRTLEWLYDIGLGIRAEHDLVQTAKKMVQGRTWSKNRTRFQQLLRLLNEFPQFDFEVVLRNVFGDKNQLKLQARVAKLERDLLGFLHVCDLWKQYANSGSFRVEDKSRLAQIERFLKKYHAQDLKDKTKRVSVIASALSALKLQADEDNILRMLSPSRLNKR